MQAVILGGLGLDCGCVGPWHPRPGEARHLAYVHASLTLLFLHSPELNRLSSNNSNNNLENALKNAKRDLVTISMGRRVTWLQSCQD